MGVPTFQLKTVEGPIKTQLELSGSIFSDKSDVFPNDLRSSSLFNCAIRLDSLVNYIVDKRFKLLDS